MRKCWQAVVAPVDLALLVTLLIIAGGIWGFIELADEVIEGDTHVVDTELLLLLRQSDDAAQPLGPQWLQEALRDYTALGGTAVLTLLTLIATGYLWLEKKLHSALFLLGAVGGGMLLGMLLKDFFERPRPELVPHGSYVMTTSFPSGHSMMAAVAYLTLATLLTRVQHRRRVKVYLMVVAVLVTLLVGFSRVYLGVHWPSDVLAGWTAGAVWALLCRQLAIWLQLHGRIEPE